ncbi:unnamed protein product, partial [Amoebophrya sp. A120]
LLVCWQKLFFYHCEWAHDTTRKSSSFLNSYLVQETTPLK